MHWDERQRLSILSRVREKVKELQKGPFCPLLGLITSIWNSCKHRSICLVYRDKEGDWVIRHRDGTFFSREFSTVTYKKVAQNINDTWVYAYKIGSGDTVIDVGAGIGDDALVFSRLVGENGRVIAIEAHPATFRCLQKTIAANRLTNVTPVNVAVNDIESNVLISDGPYLSNRTCVEQGLVIGAKPLDVILRELKIEQPSLVKMNIEGAETRALKGAVDTLKKADHWVIACHDFIAQINGDETSRTYADVLELMQTAGIHVQNARADPRPWIQFLVYGSKTFNGLV
jgi:FkbM family methyltransferase